MSLEKLSLENQKLLKFFATSLANVFATDESISEVLFKTGKYRRAYCNNLTCCNFLAIHSPPFVQNKAVSYVESRR